MKAFWKYHTQYWQIFKIHIIAKLFKKNLRTMVLKHFQSGRLRTSTKLLLHKQKETTGITVEINFADISKLPKSLQKSKEYLRKNGWISERMTGFVALLLAVIPSSYSQVCALFEKQQPCNHGSCENYYPSSQWGTRMASELSKNPIPRELSLYVLSGS